MKTNHQRGDSDTGHRDPVLWGGINTTAPLSGKNIQAGHYGNDFEKGKRGAAKSKHGAKKYVRSRTRFHENAEVRRLARLVYDAE